MIFPKLSSHPPLAGDDLRKLALALAIGLHVLGFLLILFPPTFLMPHRDLTEVQTINLFDAGELMQPASSGPKQKSSSVEKKSPPPEPKKEEPPPPPKPKQEEPPPPEPEKPEPPPEPEPVPEPPKPEPPPEPEKVIPVEPPKPIPTPPEKAISLEPKKVKKKVAPEKPPPEKAEKAKPEKPKPAKADDKILKSLEKIQARVKQKQENQALKDQLSRLRDSLHQIAPSEPTSGEAAPGSGGVDSGGTAASGPGGGPSSMLDEALKKYYIAISRKIHSNWALPDTQDWDPNLEAIAVIVIKRDGTVVDTFFEKKSDNIYFDQYVEKTIQAALPMPPFPSDLNEDELEIGLKFRPSGLF